MDTPCPLIAAYAVRAELVQSLLDSTGMEEVVPEVYAGFRPVVKDGAAFILSSVSEERFSRMTAVQLALSPDAPAGRRLAALALEMPMLQKLGQIIARNPNVERRFRDWLVTLENSILNLDIGGVKSFMEGELPPETLPRVDIHGSVSMEASVAAVVGFTWKPPGAATVEGVFKFIKPDVPERLREDISLLDKLARFFDSNRQRYAIKDFRFIETFRDVREALLTEIDLESERKNLLRARRYYEGDPEVVIPRLLPPSTARMTAMEFVPGVKITDAGIFQAGGAGDLSSLRRRCAASMFDAVVCKCLFHGGETGIFHGDPHAGNALAVDVNALAANGNALAADGEGKDGDGPGRNAAIKVALLDWSLLGELSRPLRVSILKLTTGIVAGMKDRIFAAVGEMCRDDLEASPPLAAIVRGRIEELRYPPARGFMDMGLGFLDALAFDGLKFPKDLLLFRKSVFTLRGVLEELSPGFDMDGAIAAYVNKLVMAEIPCRWAATAFPFMDEPRNYLTLTSNADLLALSAGMLMSAYNRRGFSSHVE
jgi:ubiquinone biosynthesis protein